MIKDHEIFLKEKMKMMKCGLCLLKNKQTNKQKN